MKPGKKSLPMTASLLSEKWGQMLAVRRGKAEWRSALDGEGGPRRYGEIGQERQGHTGECGMEASGIL